MCNNSAITHKKKILNHRTLKKGEIISKEDCVGIVTRQEQSTIPDEDYSIDTYSTTIKFILSDNRTIEVRSSDSFVYFNFVKNKEYQFTRITSVYKNKEVIYYESKDKHLNRTAFFE